MPEFIKIPDKPKLYQAADTENIKAVVGGKNTEHFAPSANVSFKMQSGKEQYFFNICDDIDQVGTVGKEEAWDGNKLAIRDGDVESTFKLNETSLKIERVFYTKPTVAPKYKLTFSPGVQFFYQSELTSEEIAEGCFRPDNVVGSYAVYCDQAGHYKRADGSTIANYGCGKIGHLYAPYWTDDSGKKIKGTQEIVGNILTFALPSQEWIDSAVLPIKLDPDVGYTTAGSSLIGFETVYGVKYTTTAEQSGTLDSMSVAWKNTRQATTGAIGLGLYEGSVPGSVPDAGEIISAQKVGTYDTIVDEPDDFMHLDFSGENFIISASTDYWLGLQNYDPTESSGSTLYQFYYDTTVSKTLKYGSWSNPWTGIPNNSSQTKNYSVYFTYTEDSGLLPIYSNQKRITSQTYLRR